MKIGHFIHNNKGLALIVSYLVIFSFISMAVGFTITMVNELNAAKRYRDETAAFWLAETGLHRFIQNTAMLDYTGNEQTVYYGQNYFHIIKDDSDPVKRVVTSTGFVNGVTRQLQVEFPANSFSIFNNTMASGGNIRLLGFGAYLEVFGNTQLSGTYSESGWGANAWFENKEEGLPLNQTTLTYPDANNNGTADEFDDFVEFNRDLISSYPANEVVYLTPSAGQTLTIIPNGAFADKKIVYVEGPAEGDGDVNIVFDASWQSDQDLTVISTGTVNYIQPLQSPSANSRLNVIAWDSYYEPSVLLSTHTGTTYTHGRGDYFSVLQFSVTNGTMIANDEILASEILAWKKFIHDPSIIETAPPGFEGLVGSRSAGYASTPNLWMEI